MSAGDSKSFKHVYGDVELHKDECINHIAKQPGTILHKVAAPGQKGGVPLGAQGFGQLIKTTMAGWRSFTTWQFVATLAILTKCTMQCGHHCATPRPHTRSPGTTTARWELTVGASTRRHSPLGRSQENRTPHQLPHTAVVWGSCTHTGQYLVVAKRLRSTQMIYPMCRHLHTNNFNPQIYMVSLYAASRLNLKFWNNLSIW